MNSLQDLTSQCKSRSQGFEDVLYVPKRFFLYLEDDAIGSTLLRGSDQGVLLVQIMKKNECKNRYNIFLI